MRKINGAYIRDRADGCSFALASAASLPLRRAGGVLAAARVHAGVLLCTGGAVATRQLHLLHTGGQLLATCTLVHHLVCSCGESTHHTLQLFCVKKI